MLNVLSADLVVTAALSHLISQFNISALTVARTKRDIIYNPIKIAALFIVQLSHRCTVC